MSCWHMLMGKGYNLLASSSGSVPGSCTSASWRRATKLTSSADAAADADNEHEEMVNELQAMVLIGDQWANAPDDDPSSEDNPIPSNRDPETAKIMRTENEEGDNWNNTNQGLVDEVIGSDAAPEAIETVEDYSQNLYSTYARSASIVQSSQAVDSALSSMYLHNDELLPVPVHEDVCPPRDASPLSSSPSFSHTFAHQPQIHASDVKSLDDVEESTEIEFQGTPLGDDDESLSMRRAQGEDNDKEVEGLDELEVERHPDDNGSSNARPRSPASSSFQHGELSDATPRRSSQLSKTLRNNLERLLQRGPVPLAATKTGSSRRRKTKRDDGQTTSCKRQTTKQHHRHHHHHHHHHRHHHHHHQQQQQKQEEPQREAGLCSVQDDVQSLATDTDTIRSLSATSLSGISSNSDDMTTESTTQVDRPDDVTEETSTTMLLRQSPSNLSSYDDDRRVAPSKPVAMVQPRKVHGVRVLPSPKSSRLVAGESPLGVTVKPSRLARSPAIRAPRPPRDELGSQLSVPGPSTSRWARRRATSPGDDKSCAEQRRHRYARCTRRSANYSSVVEDDGTGSNWQCRVSSTSGDGWPPVGQLAAVAEGGPAGADGWSADDGDSAAHEALLMTKKKDAEIAALLRHIRLSGMSRDANHTRRRPAFNECLIERINFERSLGYYP